MIEMSGDPSNLIPTTYIPTTSAGNVGYMVMSYPGRPPMVPGIPMPPGMGMPYMPLGGPPPMIPTVMPMAHPHMMAGPPMTALPGPLRPFRPHNQQRPQNRQRPALVPQVITGPTVTVFVGNITDKAPDQMIRHILAACGTVVSWKRVQAFGFCEYGNPDAGLRAIRILHEMEIGGKHLVAKVDAKTKDVLDEFKAEKRKKIKGRSPLQDEPEEPDDYIDEEMKRSDEAARERILAILDDYKQDMQNYSASNENEKRNQRSVTDRLALLTQASEATVKDADGPIDLDDANIEEGKRDLITREIGKFREIMKKQEEEKEVERKRKEERERERRENESPVSNGRDRDRERDRERERSRGRSQDSRASRSSSRSPSPDRRSHHKSSRHRTRSRSRDRERERERERERDRERERERDRERDKERDRERDREPRDDKKSDRDLLREKEEEEEAKERRKQERKAREKEAAYQERLRTWESRERHKAKELAKEREKKRLKEEEREKEAKRLKEFLEDYDDERDDIKYYKGRELQKRLEEREKEMEIDARDRQKEKEELEELRAKIFANPEGGDPNVEFAKALQEREEMYKPKLVIDVNAEHVKLREKEKEKEKAMEREREREREREEREREQAELEELRRRAVALAEAQQEAEDRVNRQNERASVSPARSDAPPSPEPIPEPKPVSKPWISPPIEKEKDKKKKKLDVKEVFNNDDEDDSNVGVKKRKLVPLDYGDDKKKAKEEKKEEGGRSQEEKRKHIKTLIEKIPTDKNALFAFQLDWAAVDNQLMERRIRPWINKKIIEYIGEPEPTLVDFICSKVLAGSAPQGILDDVQMVLDEEAEVFVVKMWRLLIYEIEAKKLGLVK